MNNNDIYDADISDANTDLIKSNSIRSSEVSEQKKRYTWVLLTFIAAVLFASCNAALTEITNAVGFPHCLFYFAAGSIVSAIIYNIREAAITYQNGGSFWSDQNIIINGRVNCRHLYSFIIFMMLYVIQQFLVMGSLYYAGRARMNAGIITVIWNMNPLMIALLDFCVYN